MLRERVETLLAAHTAAGEFLADSAVPTPTGGEAVVAESPGDRIDQFLLRERLGEGGCGVVYRAEQQQPLRREVALKIIKLGMDTKQVIARFEAERQALALTDHPNIARVFDAGSTASGRPYFVMELVRGVAIHKYCDTHRLSIPDRLRLFVDVCRAVQHAHQKGLVHRDLKPSNVLVALQDGSPIPKVIDFGVAKATTGRLAGATLHTELGQILGTPAYMSPEQAEMTGLDVDTRTDVYSLGVLLYEILTSTTPFEARRLREVGFVEVQRILREEEPPPPSSRARELGDRADVVSRARASSPEALPSRLKGDLDWICLRALEKDRTRRYATPDALAADLLRHLDRKPVRAGPPSTIYVLGKFVRRNKLAVVASCAVVLALLLGIAFAAWGLIEARGERDMATDRLAFLEDVIAFDFSDLDADALVERAKVLGDDHGAVALALALSAQRLEELGSHARAEDHLRRALTLWEDRVEGGPNIAIAHASLGGLLLDGGSLLEAEDHLDQAVTIAQGLRPKPHALLAQLFTDRATLMRRRGDFSGAARALERTLGALRICAPDNHGRLGRVFEEQAAMHEAAGNGREAAAARRRATDELVLAYPDTVVAADQYLALGLSFQQVPGLAGTGEAARHLRAGLDIYERHPSLQGMRYLAGLVGLARTLANGDDTERLESDALWDRALEVGKRLHGESLEYAALLEDRATLLESLDRHDEALLARAGALEVKQQARTLSASAVREFIEDAGAAAASALLPEDADAEGFEFAGEMLDTMMGLDPLAGPLYSLPSQATRESQRATGVGEVTDLLAFAILSANLGQREWASELLGRARPLAEAPEALENETVRRLLKEAEALLSD